MQSIGANDVVLLVEDDKGTRDLLKSHLEGAGYQVLSTSRGDKAIQLAIKEKPDIIILDIILEGPIDGYGVARSLNSLDEARSPYIIFLSTKREVRDRVQGFATGAHDFISKEDFSAEEFLARVENGFRIKKTHDALRDRSNIDGLTELFNHRFFMEELKKEIQKAQRHGYSLSLAFIDVDNFKSFNDRFGHYVGDRVLRRIADLIKLNCRNTDISARYGGEEFAILLPATDIEGAKVVMERLRKAVANEKIPVRGHGVMMQFETITISIGVSFYAPGLEPREFIDLADKKALYRAKSAGKNRTYLFMGYDDNQQEVIVDAAGRAPKQIDISDLFLKLNEVEARVTHAGIPGIEENVRNIRKEAEKMKSNIDRYYQRRNREVDVQEENDEQ